MSKRARSVLGLFWLYRRRCTSFKEWDYLVCDQGRLKDNVMSALHPVILETLMLFFPGNWLRAINSVAVLMWKDFTHRAAGLSDGWTRCSHLPADTIHPCVSCGRTAWLHGARHNGPMCAVACDGWAGRAKATSLLIINGKVQRRTVGVRLSV